MKKTKFTGSGWLSGIFHRIKRLFTRPNTPLSDIEQARRLIAAVQRGGIPLNPAKVNAVARNLGLEVSRHAPVEHTLQRLREAIRRAG